MSGVNASTGVTLAPPPSLPSATIPWRPAAGLAAIGAAVVTATAFDGPVLCPWRLCTGTACPGCGASRAAWELARGDLAMSWRFHPLVIVLALQFAVATALAVSPSGRRSLRRRSSAILMANGVLLAVTWIVRWQLGLLDFVLAS